LSITTGRGLALYETERDDAALAGPAAGTSGSFFGIYVHIPFCQRRCDYCAFATWTDRNHLWERYVSACQAQASHLVGAATPRGPATSVFFGGGTPSFLPADLLLGVLEALRETTGIATDAEVTVECNPETVSGAKLEAYRRGGVTRLSFGVQSMVPHVLVALGRQHDPDTVKRAVELAGEAGYAGAFNVDLIFGAAGEGVADWQTSLESVLSLEPTPAHVSAYALTVEPGTPLAAQPSRHPGDEDQVEKYMLAERVLAGAGLEWYEISNWAVPGARCAHNLLYWSQGEYLGIGCAAHSHLVRADGTARRWWNVRTPERFCRLVEEGRSTEAAGEDLGPDERSWEALMLNLRTTRGVPAAAVPGELYDAGLLDLSPPPENTGEARAVLTPRGRLLANEVAVRLKL
jgi:putative oxygen-independent coproporphyrinogen III oxidase